MLSIFNNLIAKTSKRLKEKNGMTLVEVVIAFLIIAIVSTVLVRGTVTAVNTMRINKSKTVALAIANEKIEILKAIDYSKILITEDDGSNPWLSEFQPDLAEIEGEFTISYLLTWVDAGMDGDVDIYKQLKVSVFGDYMTVPVDVVTQLYPPVGEEASIGNIYPPPDNLRVISDEGEGESRLIILNWNAPDTDKGVSGYNVYRGGDFLKYSIIESCPDSPNDNNEYTYHVTTVYDDDIESVKSNSVSTGTPFIYPPPINLTLVVSGGGPNRTSYLSWEAPELDPDTDLVIFGYQVYAEGINSYSITTLADVFDHTHVIGNNSDHYTYYVKTIYIDDDEELNESEPSNIVSTTD